ncbi:MAG: hypothetical protein GC160_11335 [Acidobacteria bacterium]|nr:hypothetical protein [Acidobacteriota bacterium]
MDPTVIQYERSDGAAAISRDSGKTLFYGFALLLLALSGPAARGQSAAPPNTLLKTIAANGSLFERELGRYTYRQTFHFFELDQRGGPRGDYLEVRDVTFDPAGERTEAFVKGPIDRLRNMRLTEEDFRDIRDMQPFVLTEDTLWLYDTRYEGEEPVQGRNCYVYRVSPRQLLEGQRLLDGRIWVDPEVLQVVQAAGQPQPQHYHTKDANLFPRFMTVYEPIDGKFWFPVRTEAQDTLAFPSGLQRVRYEIDYADYKRFSADTSITFEPSEGGETPQP